MDKLQSNLWVSWLVGHFASMFNSTYVTYALTAQSRGQEWTSQHHPANFHSAYASVTLFFCICLNLKMSQALCTAVGCLEILSVLRHEGNLSQQN